MSARVPAGLPDFIGRTSLVDVKEIGPGLVVTYRARPAVVCVGPQPSSRLIGVGDVLLRYLDGDRERILASPYDCCVGWEDE